MKIPVFIIFCFFSQGSSLTFLVNLLCLLRFLVLALFFWVFSYRWFYCWCTMMLSSSTALVRMSFVVSFDLLGWVFLVYVV